MSAWAIEKGFAGRYLLSGAGNTIVGFSLIFGLMWVGVSAYVANLAGYALGMLLGFFVSRSFVFNAAGAFNRQMCRYSLAFVLSVALNIVVLTLSLELFGINRFLSQCLAAASFTVSMYLTSRIYVFNHY
jgi:putative flippase GtrA